MTFLDRLERIFGRFAISGLTRYIVGFNALVFILARIDPNYVGLLTLDRSAIAAGQVWRVVTWVFVPDTFNIIFILFLLNFLWWVGDSLEATWGTFRLNIYCLIGFLGCLLSALVFGPTGANLSLSLSLLLAAATLAPNLEIIFIIFPLKLKWAAALAILGDLYLFVVGELSVKMAVLVSLANYFIFFGPVFARQARDARQVQARRAKFEAAQFTASSLHRCEACGKTELSDPQADFRVAEDDREYCLEHLPR